MNKVTELIEKMNKRWIVGEYKSKTDDFYTSVENVLKPKRKSIVFKTAWTLVKGWGMSLSEALKKAWKEVLN